MPFLNVFDVDGTLTRPKSGAGPFRTAPDDWEWLPRRVARLRFLLAGETRVAFATNQGGVAYGLPRFGPEQTRTTPELMNEQFQIMCDEIGPGVLFRACYHHPQGYVPELKIDCPDRKPKPGMLLSLMQETGASVDETTVIGDRPEDQDAAAAAGCLFMWSWEYFGDDGPPPPEPVKAKVNGAAAQRRRR